MPNLTNYQRELVEAANRLSIHLPGEARIPILESAPSIKLSRVNDLGRSLCRTTA